jgi:polyhydroxybutyrate depolymerase
MDIEFSSGNDAIVVGADGINKYWGLNDDSVNLLFFDRMLETISNQYCIDRDHVFSYGFSAGGFFTNMLACERGDVLRANAAVAGGLRGGYRKGKVATWLLDALGSNGAVLGGNSCKGKVANWFLHDQDDNTVPIAKGKAARERALAINGCSSNTIDEGDGCVRYQDCGAAPVVWCESKGFGHNIRGDFAPAQVWKFFQTLH